MSFLTAANQLTFLRLMLVPVFALAMLYRRPGWALATFLIAGATDAFDGLIARRMGQPTTLGAWLDPMADKLLLLTMFVMLTLPGLALANRVPLWLTVHRDQPRRRHRPDRRRGQSRRRRAARSVRRSSARPRRAIYILTGVCALYENYRGVASPLVPVFVYLSLAMTLVSAVHYILRVLAWLSAGEAQKQDQTPAG